MSTRTAIAAALAAAAITTASPVHATPEQDVTFLDLLDRNGIHYPNATLAVQLGRAICVDLRNGITQIGEARILSANSGLHLDAARKVTAAAMNIYCPWLGTAPAGVIA